ncbi:cache domain-containing protein [Desulfosediminicola flagellatus]|uniref:cache domain-containing protein n=1 Tax=Desulfosediminicola flagellatus TaxID=2569541 RepID=UPI0010AC917B|nr:cache and HAMP domain-containing protein [Desulfosediminicola flagellatus]
MEASNASEDNVSGFTIRYQILITMMIIALIPLGGLWYISIHKARQDWSASIYRTLVGNTVSLSERVDEWTAMNLRLLEQNSKVPDLRAMDADSQNPVLKSITDAYDWIYLAFTIQPDGENIGRSDGKPVKFYGDRDYFKQVMGGKDFGRQVLLGKTSGKPAYILSSPIVSDRNKNAGVLAIAMTLEDLSATVTKTRIGETGFAILVDDRKRLIAHGQGKIANELQDMSNHPVLKSTARLDENSFVFEYQGKKIVGYTLTTAFGWQLIVQQDYEEAYRSANKARLQALMLLGVTLIMVVLIAFLLAQRLSTPIRNLTSIAEQISRGNLNAVIQEVNRKDEIGALARAIERMGVSLQMAFDRLRKKT